MSLLSDTLQQLGGAAGKRLKVFSYQERFASLWQMVARPQESGTLCTMVIVWDGIPKGQTGAVNTSRYLTPIDWAVALGLQCRDAFPSFRVLVFDLGSHLVRDADALRILPMLAQALPWFSIYRVDKAPEFVDAFLESGRPCTAEKNTVDHLDLLRQIWAANLSRTSNTDDHHALFNLLGPQLLLRESSRTVDPTVSALRTLMGSVGLLPNVPKNDDGLLGDPWIKKENYGQTRLRLVLVDDQWRDGWGEVLCKAVGADYGFSDIGQDGPLPIGASKEGDISVLATTSPEWLLEKLEAKCDDQRFCFRVAEDPEEEGSVEREEVLFLDLRLFSGHGGGQAEANHIEKLVAIARRIMASGRPLPWPGFLDEDLTDIESWLKEIRTDKGEKDKDARNDPRYHKALTLLPRILALVDLSLPIIIFSSTGRREIVKEFEVYGNIITVFEKPRLQGQEQQDIAAQAGAQFRAAFQEAMELVDGRRICSILQTTSFLGPITPISNEISSSEHPWTLELYTDETGCEFDTDGTPKANPQPVTVGGLIALFSPNANPDEFNTDLLRQIERDGIKDKDSVRLNTELIFKQINSDSELKVNLPSRIAKFTLRGIIPPEEEDVRTGVLERFHDADNLYQDLARNGLEIAVYHLSRQWLPADASVSCRIHMATRHIPVTKDSAYSKALFTRFGIPTVYVGKNADLWEAYDKSFKFPRDLQNKIVAIKRGEENKKCIPKERIRYLNFDSIRLMARDVAGHYRFSPFRPMIDHARSYVLPFDLLKKVNNLEETDYRALHLLADGILNPQNSGDCIIQVQQNGFEDTMDHSLQVLIHGARLASCGQKVDALANSAETAVELCKYGQKGRNATVILIAPLQEAVQSMTGSEFLIFLSRRKEQEILMYANASPKLGNVIQCQTDYDVIVSNRKQYIASRKTNRPILRIGDEIEFYARTDVNSLQRFVSKIISIIPPLLWEKITVGMEFAGRVREVKEKNRYIIEIEGTTGLLDDKSDLQIKQMIFVRVKGLDKEQRTICLEHIEKDYDSTIDKNYTGRIVKIYKTYLLVNIELFNELFITAFLHYTNVSAIDEDIINKFEMNDIVEVKVLQWTINGPGLGLVKNITQNIVGKYATPLATP